MAKITRYTGDVKAFASNAQGTERTRFGETTQSDALADQITADFLRGWGIVGPSDNPTREDFNALGYTLSQFIAYLHQAGVPEWDVAQEYFDGAITNRNGLMYRSVTAANIGNDPAADDGSNWLNLSSLVGVEIPVSTTSSGGTEGINYDVAYWPSTLVSGRSYYFRCHTNNIAFPQIGSISVLRPDGKNAQPLDLVATGIMGARFDGTNLRLHSLQRYPDFSVSAVTGSTYTRIMRIRFTGSSGDARIRAKFYDKSLSDYSGILDVAVRESDLSNPDTPAIAMLVHDLVGGVDGSGYTAPTKIQYDSFRAWIRALTTSEVVIDIYKGGTDSSPMVLSPEDVSVDNANSEIHFFNDEVADTEANITGGSFDVVSRPAAGELLVVSPENFGARRDGATDDASALQSWWDFLKSNTNYQGVLNGGTYRFGSTLAFDGNDVTVRASSDARLEYNGSSNAITLTGDNHRLEFGEIAGGVSGTDGTTETLVYRDLRKSEVRIGIIGGASTSLNAVILHDGASATENAGTNRWVVQRVEAGNADVGVQINSSSSVILEGEQWSVVVILSAKVRSFQVGSSTVNQTVRFNGYDIAPDGQNITPVLIDFYNNRNYLFMQPWGTGTTSEINFQLGTEGNLVDIAPGTGSALDAVVDDNGENVVRRHRPQEEQIGDDGVYSFKPDRNKGIMAIYAVDGLAALLTYHVANDVSSIHTIGGGTWAATTGTLSGTMGTDGNVTVSVHSTDEKVYIENRSGISRRFSWEIFASNTK